MPAHRTRLAAAAAVLALFAPLTAVTTADAGTQEAQGTRTVTIKGVEPNPGRFFAKGKVRPEYAERGAIMQRKLRSQSRWRDDFRFETSAASRYRQRIKPLRRVGTVCYRVKVNASNGYARAFSERVCIRTFRG